MTACSKHELLTHCIQERWTRAWDDKSFRRSFDDRMRKTMSSNRITMTDVAFASQQFHACAKQYLLAAEEHEAERNAAGVFYVPNKRRNGASWEDEQHRMFCYSFYYTALLKIALGINVAIPDRPCDQLKRVRS